MPEKKDPLAFLRESMGKAADIGRAAAATDVHVSVPSDDPETDAHMAIAIDAVMKELDVLLKRGLKPELLVYALAATAALFVKREAPPDIHELLVRQFAGAMRFQIQHGTIVHKEKPDEPGDASR